MLGRDTTPIPQVPGALSKQSLLPANKPGGPGSTACHTASSAPPPPLKEQDTHLAFLSQLSLKAQTAQTAALWSVISHSGG